MNARTKAKLVLAVQSVAIATPVVLLDAPARATVHGPYTIVDANTVALFHLDETAGSSIAANSQALGSSAIGWNTGTAPAIVGAPSTLILGQTGASGFGFGNFGNAATFSGNMLLGYDFNNNGTYDQDTSANTTGATAAADAINSTIFTGGSGEYSVEAIVKFSNALGTGNREIVSWDSSNGNNGLRGFQFRVNAAGQLEYNNIADAFGSVTGAIPTTGADAFALDTWFHVAMTYDGSAGANSVRLYWTRLDDANVQSHLLATGQAGDLTGSANPHMLTFGNENRAVAGEPLGGTAAGAWGGLDEVRISNSVRLSTQMQFDGLIANYWNLSGGGAWEVAGNWTDNSVPNAAGAAAYFGGGVTPPAQDSTITITGGKTVGSLTFDSAAFLFALTDGGGGSLTFDQSSGITVISGAHEIAVPIALGSGGVAVQTSSAASTLTLSGNITGTTPLSKSGPGTLVLASTANTYTGATSVTEGTLRATNAVTLPTTTNLLLNGGVLETGVDFARAAGTGANQVQLPGGSSGFVSPVANLNVAIGTLAAPAALSWGSATFNPSSLVLGGTAAVNGVTFLNPINLNGGSRTVAVNTGSATLTGNITNSTGTGNLTKTGGGLLVLSGSANTYAGTTTIAGGILRANDGSTLPSATNLSLNGGLLQTTANVNRTLGTGTNQIQVPGGNSGFTTNGSDITVTISNGGNPIVWGGTTGGTLFNPGQLILNAAGAPNNITLNADFDLNGANRVFQVNAGVNTFTGAISGSTALLVQGAGTIVMTSTASTYSGGTGISDNAQNTPTIVRAAASNALGTGNISIASQGNQSSSRLQLINGITLPNSISFLGRRESQTAPQIQSVSGNNELSGAIRIEVGGQNWFAQSDADTLTLSGAANGGVAVTITAASVSANPRPISLQGAGNGVVSGAMNNGATGNTLAVIKNGTGTWALTNSGNSYTGPVSVGEGTLTIPALANGGISSPLGASGNAATSLVITGGTLQYTGPGVSTDRLFTVTAAGGAIDASGSGTLTFNNGGATVSSDPANRATALDFVLNTSTAVVQLPGVLDLVPGMSVTSTGASIAPGTTIVSVNKQLLQVTLSQAPLTTGADTLSFSTADRVLTLTGSGDGVLANSLSDSGGGGKLGVSKTGTGSWALTHAANTYTGPTSVSAGTLRVQANLTASSAVLVSGGKLELTSNGTYNRVIRTPSVLVTGGQLDIQNNKVIATATPVGSWNGTNYTDLTGSIASGRNGNTLPLWDGSGIVTNQSSATGGNFHSIGVSTGTEVLLSRGLTAADTMVWGGQTITGSDSLVMYTYGGDANLDGKLNIDDYVAIDQGIASQKTGWSNGDFNYDGKVNIDDYTTVIDSNIGNQNAFVFPTAGGIEGLGVSAVPEPGSLTILSLALAAATRRRRRC